MSALDPPSVPYAPSTRWLGALMQRRQRILVNGIDLRDFSLASLFQHMALVPQAPFLFATTIREIIRYGRPSASDFDVISAARAAELHDDIESWPDGYGTVVGIGGRPLSKGLAQRVNIARALVKDAPLLLLDEASSSLDSITEAKVQRAIETLTRGRSCDLYRDLWAPQSSPPSHGAAA